MRTGSIYIIKNTVNDKVYIGQTTMTVHERFMVHMKPSTAKLKRNCKLYNAVTKYGFGITKTVFYRIKKSINLKSRPQIYKHKTRYHD